jgi:uncharacterized protein YgiM (DUF1202 family)
MKELILFGGLIFGSQLLLAATVESQKDGVEVYSSADKSSAVIQKLKKGDKLSAGERKGMYWQVKTSSGKDGFVNMLLVKVKPDENPGLADAMREAAKKGRSQSAADGGRTRSAVMGVRGLDDTGEVGVAANLRPNLHAVYRMEDFNTVQDGLTRQGELVMKEVGEKVGGLK